MNNNIRHGDLALIQVEKLPEGLKKAKTEVIMKGSHGNDHIAKNCELYFKRVDQFIFGYLVAKKDSILLHIEHGKIIPSKKLRETNPLPEGVIFELRRQQEDTHTGMKAVVD